MPSGALWHWTGIFIMLKKFLFCSLFCKLAVNMKCAQVGRGAPTGGVSVLIKMTRRNFGVEGHWELNSGGVRGPCFITLSRVLHEITPPYIQSCILYATAVTRHALDCFIFVNSLLVLVLIKSWPTTDLWKLITTWMLCFFCGWFWYWQARIVIRSSWQY